MGATKYNTIQFPVSIFNSIDFLEIAVNMGNAAALLDIRKGSTVNLLFGQER